jgi:hypothetical protein
LADLKRRIDAAQTRATLSVNRELSLSTGIPPI